MAMTNEPATPPPTIGKMGPYTVFVTPPPPDPSYVKASESPSRYNISTPQVKSAAPVQPPPIQYEKSSSLLKTGFFWDALAKVQNGINCQNSKSSKFESLSKYNREINSQFFGKNDPASRKHFSRYLWRFSAPSSAAVKDGILCSMLCGESDLTIMNVSVFVIMTGPSLIVTSNGISPNSHESSPEKPTRGVLESTRRDLIDGFNFRKQCSYITLHELPLSKYALFTCLPDMYTLITTGSDEPLFGMGET
nr:hypothetical protein [Tanacetum cinerariifolium]